MPGLTRPRRRAGRGDRGAVTVLVAILLSSGVLLGMTAYAIDIGVLYAYREQALNAANEAAMAGAQTCVRPGTRCGALDPKYATQNIGNAGDVKLRSNNLGDAVCGRDRDTGQLSPCSGTSGAKGCFDSADNIRTSYTEVHVTTAPPSGSTVYPANFAGSVVPGWKPYGVQVCSRVEYGAPQGPYAALGMSLCAFKVLTGGTSLPHSNGFHAVYDTGVPAGDEIVLNMESQADAPTDTCPDLGYYDTGSGCQVTTREGGSLTGHVNNTTSTVPLPTGCRSFLDRKERPPSRPDPQPYLLIPIYQTITVDNGADVVFGNMFGVAAFQVTGDHLGDGTGKAAATGTDDWLSGVSEDDYCRPNSTKPTDRCIRGYFLWVNIIDGKQPSTQWRHTLAVATFKTVG